MSEVELAVGPALPGEPCRVPPHESWSDLEKWVWQEVGSGRIADLDAKLGITADPTKPGDWQPERRLCPTFLETILLHDPWRSAIPRQGVRLEGVWLEDPLELSHALIPCTLWFRRSRLEAGCRIVGSDFSAPFILHETFVRGDFCMDAARVRSHLLFRNSTFEEIDLKNAQIDGQVSLQQSSVSQLLRLHGAHIRGSVFLRAYETTEWLLPGIGQASFGHLDFIGTVIDRDLNLQGAHISGEIRMEHLAVGGDVFFRDTHFQREVGISYTTIGGSLDLRGARVKAVDLTGSRIARDLRLAVAERSPRWSDSSRLDLYNAHVDAIVDEPSPSAWPRKIGLDGFTYSRFGGFRVEGPGKGIAERTSKWFINWLARSQPYTPQPYHQCAKVLREIGHPEMANDVLYAGRERERKEALQNEKGVPNYARAAGLWLLKSTVGYGLGYRYFYALNWVLLFVLLGIAVLLHFSAADKVAGTIVWSAQGVISHLLALAFFSFDLLLPIIELHKPHYDVVLDGVTRYYFAFHKLMGYVLASFLIAGLAGLTK